MKLSADSLTAELALEAKKQIRQRDKQNTFSISLVSVTCSDTLKAYSSNASIYNISVVLSAGTGEAAT